MVEFTTASFPDYARAALGLNAALLYRRAAVGGRDAPDSSAVGDLPAVYPASA